VLEVDLSVPIAAESVAACDDGASLLRHYSGRGGSNGVGKIVVPSLSWGRLHEHQRQGISWMWGLHKDGVGGILGDQMGLGKAYMPLLIRFYNEVFIHNFFLVATDGAALYVFCCCSSNCESSWSNFDERTVPQISYSLPCYCAAALDERNAYLEPFSASDDYAWHQRHFF